MVGANLSPKHDLGKRLKKLDDQRNQLNTRDILQNASIGAGGITVYGGSIRVIGGGSISLDTGTFVAGVVHATSTLQVDGNEQVNGSSNVNGTMSAGGVSTASLYAGSGVSSPGVYNNLLTTAYRVQYINAGGPMGYVPSSAQFKQDISTATTDERALALHVVIYRYIQAVEQFGEDAPWDRGVLAEELHDLGFTWAVDYDEHGEPFGVKYERLILAYIPIIQDHERRLSAGGL